MNAQTALDQLQTPTDLAILSLSAPYLSPDATDSHKRTSDSSNADRSTATPAILAADLAHYRDLFSKLRFSYVEQVTKERFLRAITAEQPEFVDSAENGELQERLLGKKAALKERKGEVREIVEALGEQGRHLAGRYENVELQTAELSALPGEIANLEASISSLRQSSQSNTNTNNDPALSMPLQPTLDLLASRENELASINAQLEALQSTLPTEQSRIENLQDELSVMQTRKIKAVEEAQEARRRRENGGGGGDELEAKGRWLRGVEGGLRTMLEV